MHEPGNNTTLPRVDFYLLQASGQQAIQHFCCRLAEKAWKLGHTVYIRTASEAQSRQLDDLMWSYSETGFLPHALAADATPETTVIISHHAEPSQTHDLLINLADDTPGNNHLYQRIAEIINEDADVKQRGRMRYAQYDKGQFPLHHHTIRG